MDKNQDYCSQKYAVKLTQTCIQPTTVKFCLQNWQIRDFCWDQGLNEPNSEILLCIKTKYILECIKQHSCMTVKIAVVRKFIPVWLTSCSLRWHFCQNRWPQVTHTNGRSIPLCSIFWWLFNPEITITNTYNAHVSIVSTSSVTFPLKIWANSSLAENVILRDNSMAEQKWLQ